MFTDEVVMCLISSHNLRFWFSFWTRKKNIMIVVYIYECRKKYKIPWFPILQIEQPFLSFSDLFLFCYLFCCFSLTVLIVGSLVFLFYFLWIYCWQFSFEQTVQCLHVVSNCFNLTSLQHTLNPLCGVRKLGSCLANCQFVWWEIYPP